MEKQAKCEGQGQFFLSDQWMTYFSNALQIALGGQWLFSNVTHVHVSCTFYSIFKFHNYNEIYSFVPGSQTWQGHCFIIINTPQVEPRATADKQRNTMEIQIPRIPYYH